MVSRTDRQLRSAIKTRRLIELQYDGYPRLAEPHDYGVYKGVVTLLAYQVGGGSRSGHVPGWKFFTVSKMAAVRLRRQPFPGGRGSAHRHHLHWETLFMRVTPARPSKARGARRPARLAAARRAGAG